MKGFKFKLQSVLEIREKKFEDSQLEFALAQTRLHQEELKLANLVKIQQDTVFGLEDSIKSGGINKTMIFVHQNYIVKLKEDIRKQQVIIGNAQKEVHEKNKLMLVAMKDKKVMEKLKERALSEFKTSMEKYDLLMIDEISTNRYKKAI